MAHDWRNPERVVPWKPRQRFLISPLGLAAHTSYQTAVQEAQRSASPRTELERAKQAWADGLKLRPVDGIVLEELAAGRNSLVDMKETLEACGISLREARGALDRLRAARLLDPVEPGEQA